MMMYKHARSIVNQIPLLATNTKSGEMTSLIVTPQDLNVTCITTNKVIVKWNMKEDVDKNCGKFHTNIIEHWDNGTTTSPSISAKGLPEAYGVETSGLKAGTKYTVTVQFQTATKTGQTTAQSAFSDPITFVTNSFEYDWDKCDKHKHYFATVSNMSDINPSIKRSGSGRDTTAIMYFEPPAVSDTWHGYVTHLFVEYDDDKKKWLFPWVDVCDPHSSVFSRKEMDKKHSMHSPYVMNTNVVLVGRKEKGYLIIF